MVAKPPLDHERLAALCRRHRIRRLAVFGSYLRDDFGPDSDVDLLVDYEPGHSPGWEVVDVEAEVVDLLGGRRVALVNRKLLNRRLAPRIDRSAMIVYEGADGREG